MALQIKNLVVGPLLTNCYILTSNNEATVIDPGAGLEQILKEIKGKKLNYIILTHFHWDHTLAAPKLKQKTGAKILIHEEEKDFIKSAPHRTEDYDTGFQPDQFLKDGEKIRAGKEFLKVIHTPGHTKGSICLAGDNFIFTGDTLFEDGTGRTDLPGGSQKGLENSLKKLKKILKPGWIIYPGHGEIFKK